MILVFIYNKKLLTKVISYLDNLNIPYTTDLSVSYEYIIIGEENKRILNCLNQSNIKSKKIIFLTHLFENKILNKKIDDINNILDKSYKVVVTLPSIKESLPKKIRNKTVIIERELPNINISKNNDLYNRYKISKRKKKIVIYDFSYNNLNLIYELSIKYPKINFVLIGYKPDYSLKNKELEILYSMPNNISYIKYYDFDIISNITKLGNIVINFESDIEIKYLYMILLLKKQLLMKDGIKYSNYLINSKNTYLFKNDLIVRLNKILENRVANLTENGYELIKNNTFNEIIKRYSKK